VLAALTYGGTAWLPLAARLEVHAVLLAAIGAIYVGFALADGRQRTLAVEVAGALLFGGMAVAGLWTSAWVLAAGYALHGVWDALHHRSAIPGRYAPWYIPLCAVYDTVVAAYLLVL
jgi:hypothetical protein